MDTRWLGWSFFGHEETGGGTEKLLRSSSLEVMEAEGWSAVSGGVTKLFLTLKDGDAPVERAAVIAGWQSFLVGWRLNI